MKPGPKAALALLPKVFSITSPPRSAEEWVMTIALSEGWCHTDAEASELAARWMEPFLAALRAEVSEMRRVGRVSSFDINSSSEYMIQGAAFIEPRDSIEVQEAKTRLARLSGYAEALGNLTAHDFEAVCRGILDQLQVENVQLTERGVDEGIDFYGRLRLERLLLPTARLPGIETQLSVWMVGQAKHFRVGQVSTPDVRDLVGAVELAKSGAYSTGEQKYPDLQIRACDPVVYLFFTTGRISSYAWRLLDRSGVVGMDGEMVAAFLADRGIGVEGGELEPTQFEAWVRSHG
jgi:hypothetical protein